MQPLYNEIPSKQPLQSFYDQINELLKCSERVEYYIAAYYNNLTSLKTATLTKFCNWWAQNRSHKEVETT